MGMAISTRRMATAGRIVHGQSVWSWTGRVQIGWQYCRLLVLDRPLRCVTSVVDTCYAAVKTLFVPPKIGGVKHAPNVGTACRGGSRGVRGYELRVALQVELNAAAPLVRAAPDRSRFLFVESEERPRGPGHRREDHRRVVNGAAWVWRRPPHKVAFAFLGARSFVHAPTIARRATSSKLTVL